MRMPLTVWGIFTATVMALLAFPALFVASVMMLLDRILGTSFFMPTLGEMGPADEVWRRQPDPVPAPFLVLRSSRSLHRRIAGFRHHFRSDQRPRAEEYLRLSHDGLGDRGNGALSFCRMAHHMYVSGMHPYFGYFFATTDAYHRHPDRHQGFTTGC